MVCWASAEAAANSSKRTQLARTRIDTPPLLANFQKFEVFQVGRAGGNLRTSRAFSVTYSGSYEPLWEKTLVSSPAAGKKIAVVSRYPSSDFSHPVYRHYSLFWLSSIIATLGGGQLRSTLTAKEIPDAWWYRETTKRMRLVSSCGGL